MSDKPAIKAARRIADVLSVSEHQVTSIAAIIEEEVLSPWRSGDIPPQGDGVDVALFMMNYGDRHPVRGYYCGGWRDAYGNPLNGRPHFWMEIPLLPDRPTRTLEELREAFIVKVDP